MKEQTIDTINSGNYHLTKGATTVAPEVLLTIARLTTLNVPGVSRMGSVAGGVNRLFKGSHGEGVRIDIRNDVVYMELFLILEKDRNIREVSRQVQRDVARAISEMVGLSVGRINIHVEDIDYAPPAEATLAKEE